MLSMKKTWTIQKSLKKFSKTNIFDICTHALMGMKKIGISDHISLSVQNEGLIIQSTARPDPCNGPDQPFFQRHFRLPAKELLRACYIRPPPEGVILRQGMEGNYR
jgi:hypothetical protein